MANSPSLRIAVQDASVLRPPCMRGQGAEDLYGAGERWRLSHRLRHECPEIAPVVPSLSRDLLLPNNLAADERSLA